MTSCPVITRAATSSLLSNFSPEGAEPEEDSFLIEAGSLEAKLEVLLLEQPACGRGSLVGRLDLLLPRGSRALLVLQHPAKGAACRRQATQMSGCRWRKLCGRN